MSRGLGYRNVVRASGRLIVSASIVVAAGGLAGVARAEISSVDPGQGEVMPGGTVTADVTVEVALLTCLTATASDPLNITVTFDGETLACGGSRTALMEVTVTSSIEPGDYVVTIEETLDGGLLGTVNWPLTVLDPDSSTTTTTSSTTTTTSSTTTTTSTTTTSSTTTTTSSTTTTTPDSTTTTTTTPASTSDSATTTAPATDPPGDSTPGDEPTDEPTDDPVDAEASAPPGSNGGQPPSGNPSPGSGDSGGNEATEEAFSEIALSSRLLETARGALPAVFAEAVASPIVLLEVLVRSLTRVSMGLFGPLAATAVLGVALIWRLRRDDLDLEAEMIPNPTNGQETGR